MSINSVSPDEKFEPDEAPIEQPAVTVKRREHAAPVIETVELPRGLHADMNLKAASETDDFEPDGPEKAGCVVIPANGKKVWATNGGITTEFCRCEQPVKLGGSCATCERPIETEPRETIFRVGDKWVYANGDVIRKSVM
jgi:hypothetical protein